MLPKLKKTENIKKILEDFKKDINSNTIRVGNFNTPLSKKDRSSKQNINSDIVTEQYPRWNGLNRYTQNFSSPKIKIHILFKCAWNFFKDRPHDRTQSKPQQIQENWNHIKHFVWPLGTENRKQPKRKKPKTLKLMQIE